MEKSVEKEEISSQEIYLRFSLKKLCLMTVVLPMSALVICFITANIFQRDDVHETHCRIFKTVVVNLNLCSLLIFVTLRAVLSVSRLSWKVIEGRLWAATWALHRDAGVSQVYNIIPSISAITGISPQRYLWRICIALHIGPRLLVAVVYRDYHAGLLDKRGPGSGQWLPGLCFWLSILEIVTLCGVTYVSNRENYPVHEKIFITFMVSSLCYMLATLKIHNVLHPLKPHHQQHSYKLKKLFFIASLLSTLGLFVFFIKHRFLCHDMAFSWFSTCEYLIAFFNMSFHMTVVLDFPLEEILVGKGFHPSSPAVDNGPLKWKPE